MPTTFSALLKKLRLSKGITLREFCGKNGFDPSNYSRLERGLYPPPQSSEKLAQYAKALDLQPGSDEWLDLFDTAAACRGEIPKDLLSDEELVAKLPVLFRTIRKKRLAPEELDSLAEKIRRS